MNRVHALSGAVALGMASGGAYLIHNSISKTSESTLRSRLRMENHSVMESSDVNWNTVLSKYNDPNIPSDKKFSDLAGIVTKPLLKRKCSSAISSNEASLYEKAKLWCTVPKNIQQRLLDLGIHTLKMSGEGEAGDKASWEKLSGKYQEVKMDQRLKGFETADQVDWQKLRTACSVRITKDRWDPEYDDDYLEKVTTWCSASSKFLHE
ncbi:hypothetical protein HF1_09920 [Mycoplasma haemofelis str. Langford 1]|uniref:Uncharacterized protein n=1 Tax=Mycoplasma haemofelis (strain Langford 1) TaxID=941640 RepID=E8ZIM9_MYCHL|nr:hypothetical protein [Mycoplasma haemofelis]CBY93000.1 hypothetical protein HF1_09920 [Mycoplasma haemofelis str. Langford 1]